MLMLENSYTSYGNLTDSMTRMFYYQPLSNPSMDYNEPVVLKEESDDESDENDEIVLPIREQLERYHSEKTRVKTSSMKISLPLKSGPSQDEDPQLVDLEAYQEFMHRLKNLPDF